MTGPTTTGPTTTGPTTTGQDDELHRLATLLGSAVTDLRARADLGEQVLRDPDVADSADLSPVTWARVEDALSAATAGLRAVSDDLDADLVELQDTLRSYAEIADLQVATEPSFGPAVAHSIGRLIAEVPLGGLSVPDGTGDLRSLLAANPDLIDRVAAGSGLLERLRLRSLIVAPALAGEEGSAIAREGLAAVGTAAFDIDPAAARRDLAGEVLPRPDHTPAGEQPVGLGGLMSLLFAATRTVTVLRTAPGVYVVLLPGEQGRTGDHADPAGLQLVGSERLPYADRAIRAIITAIRRHGDHRDGRARVLLAGSGPGGATALHIAALAESDLFQVDRVVTTGAPAALVPRAPRYTRMISLEDRTDPATLLGSLVNAGADNRLTLLFDGTGSGGPDRYLAAARAADVSEHPDLLEELRSLRELGYLS